MVRCHRKERDAAQCVQPADAAFAAWFVGGCVCVHDFRFSAFGEAGIRLGLAPEVRLFQGPFSSMMARRASEKNWRRSKATMMMTVLAMKT